jgi:hypothetical protein
MLPTLFAKYNFTKFDEGYCPNIDNICPNILYNLIKELLSLNPIELSHLISDNTNYGIKVHIIKNKEFIYPKHNPYEEGLTDIIESFYNSDSNDWKNYNNILKNGLGWIRYQGNFAISSIEDLDIMIRELNHIIKNNDSLQQTTSICPAIDYYNGNIIVRFSDITKYYTI